MAATTNSGVKLLNQVLRLIDGLKPGETVEIARKRGRGRRFTTRVRRPERPKPVDTTQGGP